MSQTQIVWSTQMAKQRNVHDSLSKVYETLLHSNSSKASFPFYYNGLMYLRRLHESLDSHTDYLKVRILLLLSQFELPKEIPFNDLYIRENCALRGLQIARTMVNPSDPGQSPAGTIYQLSATEFEEVREKRIAALRKRLAELRDEFEDEIAEKMQTEEGLTAEDVWWAERYPRESGGRVIRLGGAVVDTAAPASGSTAA